MHGLKLGLGGFSLVGQGFLCEGPQFFEEAAHSVYAVGIPGLALLQRTQEHLVQTQGVCSVTLYYVVRVHYIEHGLTHLLHRVTAHISAVVKHKLGIGIFRTPGAEGLKVQDIVVHYVHVHMDGGGFTRRRKGSSFTTRPRSYRNLFQKREYMRWPVACSVPPM